MPAESTDTPAPEPVTPDEPTAQAEPVAEPVVEPAPEAAADTAPAEES
jgi:hypothetical protein